MIMGGTRRWRLGFIAAAVAALLCTQAPVAPASAATASPDLLTPRLEVLRSSAALAASSDEAQNRAVGLAPTGAGSLLRSADHGLFVEVRTADTSEPTIAALRRIGHVVNVSDEYRTTTLSLAPAQLDALAHAPGLESASEILTPL